MKTPPGYEPVRAVGARGFARPRAAAWIESVLGRWGTLSRAARHDPDALVLKGRGLVRAIAAPGSDDGVRWVVRRYLRGGWMAPVLHDRYLRRSATRPALEARASDAARARGIPTPRVQAGLIYPSGLLWYRADLVTTFVPDSVDLADLLFHHRMPGSGAPPTDDQRARALTLVGQLARRIAEVGLYHPDLNAKNFLIVDTGQDFAAQVLDLDRARVTSGAVPLAPMAARLTRSLRKFETTTGVALGRLAWDAFRDATGAPP